MLTEWLEREREHEQQRVEFLGITLMRVSLSQRLKELETKESTLNTDIKETLRRINVLRGMVAWSTVEGKGS